MSLIIPPGYGSAAFIFSGSVGTPEHVTTLGLNLSEAGGDFVTAANRAMNAYGLYIMGQTYSSLTLTRVTLSVGQDGPGGSVDSDTESFTGGKTGTSQAVAMAPVVRKVTGEIGRRGRGRMFPPGMLATSEVDSNGMISAGRRTSLQTAFDDFYNDLKFGGGGGTGPTMEPVLLHSSGPGAGIPTPMTGFAVSSLVGWIRGRIR